MHQRYAIQGDIGKGAFSTVVKAIHKETDTPVAIKFIHKSEGIDMMRLERELQALKMISHPNIVAIYEACENDENLVLVLEYVGHGSLKDRLEVTQRIDEYRTKRWFCQLVHVLDHLYNVVGIVHRDLKADNILIDDEEAVKLADFGLCNFLRDAHSFLTTRCGTPTHVAPEVIKGESYGPKADLWSLGIILYHMMTGELPFVDVSVMGVIKKVIECEPEYPDTMPVLARDLISRLLMKNPSERLSLDEVKSHPWVCEYFRGDLVAGEAPPPLSEVIPIIAPRCHLTCEQIAEGFQNKVFDETMVVPRILVRAFRKPRGIKKDAAVRSMIRMDRFVVFRQPEVNVQYSKGSIRLARTLDYRRRRMSMKKVNDRMFQFHVQPHQWIPQASSCPSDLV